MVTGNPRLNGPTHRNAPRTQCWGTECYRSNLSFAPAGADTQVGFCPLRPMRA